MRGLHGLLMSHLKKGVRLMMVGTQGDVRAAADGLSNAIDQPLTRHAIDVYYPSAEHPPFRFGRRTVMLLGTGQVHYQVYPLLLLGRGECGG